MMWMLSLVFVVVLSILCFGRRYDMIQWISVTSVIIGVTLVSIASIDQSEALNIELAASKRKETISGVIALSFGVLFLATQNIIEEYILKNKGG